MVAGHVHQGKSPESQCRLMPRNAAIQPLKSVYLRMVINGHVHGADVFFCGDCAVAAGE